jgi:NTE family protein
MKPQINSPQGKNGLVLALSGGGAAGLAHIGVIQVLSENGIPVRALVGTSIGAEIGAFIASGMPIDELVNLATDFDWKQTLQLFMPDLPTGGLVSGKKIMDFLNTKLGAHSIEDLPKGFAAVTTDLETGEQVVLSEGSLVDAVRASISIPGFIAPYRIGQRWLVDGGVVNPVPFDVARELFGGPVVAVAVHSAARQQIKAMRQPISRLLPVRIRQLLRQTWMVRAKGLEEWLESQLENYRKKQDKKQFWTVRRVLDQVIHVSQAEVVRLRKIMSPPDIMLTPEGDGIGTIEFYRAKEAIAAGRAAANEKLAQIKALVEVENYPQDASKGVSD